MFCGQDYRCVLLVHKHRWCGVARFNFCLQKYQSLGMSVASWYLWWKLFQCKKERSLPAFAHVSDIKTSNLVLTCMKMTPAIPYQEIHVYYISLHHPWKISWGIVKDKSGKEWYNFVYENFSESIRQEVLYFSVRVGGSSFPVRLSYYCCCSWL